MSCFDHREVVPWALRGTCHGVQILAVGDGNIDGSTKSESSLAKPAASRSGLPPWDFLCHVQQELLVVRPHSSKSPAQLVEVIGCFAHASPILGILLALVFPARRNQNSVQVLVTSF